MDVWGPARVHGQDQERYFLVVVDDYSRYSSVFPLRTKGEVLDVLIPWIRRARLQLSERFHSDFPVLRLHYDRGGELSSFLLAANCAEHDIEQSFMLPASPQQNGDAELRIGLVMEVARTSLIHAAAPHFLWLFAVRYAAHQLNLWPRVSLPETSPTLLWTGEVGDASRFRVWVSRAFVRDTSADKLSSRAVPCVFLGFVPDASGWQFYHATLRRVLPPQDVTFDESVPYYRLFPYRTAPLPPPPPPLFLAPGAAVVDPLPPQGAAPSGVSQVDPVEVAVDSRPAGGAQPGGAEPGGAEVGGSEPGGAELLVVRAALHCSEWRARVADPAAVGAAAGATDSGVGAATGAEEPSVGAAAGATDPCVGATAGAEDPGVGAAAGAVDPGVGVATGARDPDVGAAAGAEDPRLSSRLPSASSLPAPALYTGLTGGLTERREPESRPVSPVRAALTGSHVQRQRLSAVQGSHRMALRPSTAPQRVPRPSPPASSLPALADPGSDSLRAASPTVTGLLAIVVTDPSFESVVASALVAELVDFAATCRLD
ncbi:unnamed protein product [Closterium sp. NIES-64]|nr:unnamed protein product [Closterium sp. NIES-64]